MKTISVKNINKAYNGAQVLKDFSADFEYGKCTAVMGVSGCGKTTLMKILMGIDKDYEGTVDGMPERFAVVFQENRLCEEFSVLDNLKMVISKGYNEKSGENAKEADGRDETVAEAETEKEKDAEAILRELGIAEFAGSKVSELSGGQKRRVAIARALIYDAGLLIMDEPFKGLDGDTKKAAADAIKKRKKTVIMVTHDDEEASLMGADVITMTKTDR